MSNFSRRKFLTTAAVSAAGAVVLKGCLGNPPDSTGGTTTTAPASPAASPVAVAPGEAPETTKIKLGYIPIVEAAPLIIAKEKGFFAKYGMADVEVSKQANWGSARDNVEIGADAGGIDGGQWQMPMPYLISEGLITKNNVKVPMYVLAQLNTQGNGIAIAGKHDTFPKANQDFWIRYWLAAGGINPDTDINLIAVPAAQTVANMKTGTMDAFSTGDPWPARIVADQIGFMSALTAEIWPYHPEEYLAIRADWVDKNPKATKALLKGIMEAQQWLDQEANRAEAAAILAKPAYFNLKEEIIAGPLKGMQKMGDGKPEITDKNKGVFYWKDPAGSVSYPYKSHDLWFLTESVRATELGVPAADIPTSTSRGVEKFFDGKTFDPANPQAYLDSLAIKK